MSYKIAFKKSVSRDLKKIDRDQVKRILRKIEEGLPEKAESLPVLTEKFAVLRKFRIGDSRIFYSLIEDIALILRITHRRESYR